jgi:hypothetical protein
MFSALKEMLWFLVAKRKYWLIPIVLMLLVFGGLLVAVQGSALAPFIYALF